MLSGQPSAISRGLVGTNGTTSTSSEAHSDTAPLPLAASPATTPVQQLFASHAVPGPASAASVQQPVSAGLVCAVCRCELTAGYARLKCRSKRPICGREYHSACVVSRFGHLYGARTVAVPQSTDSKWRCMVCSDMCAVCVPAAKIVANQPFYNCCNCGSKAHQDHWPTGARRFVFSVVSRCKVDAGGASHMCAMLTSGS